MSNRLKIYDFALRHKDFKNNTDYFKLATNSTDLQTYFGSGSQNSASIQRQIVFQAFLKKISDDLNKEILKNDTTKRIVKKSRAKKGVDEREIEYDYQAKNIYGILNAGKVADNSILERKNLSKTGTSNDYEYEELNNGERLYDDFFFFLHISFRCNIARLFVLTRRNNVNVDSILKKYFRDTLFKAKKFNRTLVSDFVSETYRKDVLNRSIVKTVVISKAQTILTQADGSKYQVEIKLKPVKESAFNNISDAVVDIFRKTKVTVDDDTADDVNSTVKFSINDPITKTTKTIVFGGEEGFLPALLLKDDEVLDKEGRIDVQKLKKICEGYIVYKKDQLS